jgi:hypothetical protein
MAFDHIPTATCWPQPGREGRWPAFPLVSLGVEPPAGIEPATHPYHRCAGGSQRRASPHVPAQPPRSEALWREVSQGGVRLRVAQFPGKSLARPSLHDLGGRHRRLAQRGHPVPSHITVRPKLTAHPRRNAPPRTIRVEPTRASLWAASAAGAVARSVAGSSADG